MSFDNFPLQTPTGTLQEHTDASGSHATTDQTERQWQDRLRLFRHAEQSLQNARRMFALWFIILVVGSCVLSFSIFVAPVTATWLLAAGAISVAAGLAIQPFCYLRVQASRHHRDALSKRFYNSNHEIEVTNSHLVLINRGNYTAVTQVPILEC